MDIFEYAMKMEQDGRKFYLELAENAENTGIRRILQMLADDELKHYNVLREMKSKKPEMADTRILDNAKNVFEEISREEEPAPVTGSQGDLYRKAQEIELKSKDFYQQKAAEAEGGFEKDIFSRLAKEEQKHYILLENIVGYVTRPERWLENAEWHHMDEY
ncbi:MAG: ferritin family protein [Spirochaetes bacterium]|nr:ferritin family protein [Spirochaetota bacterium]